MLVHYFGIAIESINIVQLFFDCIRLPEIIDFVTSTGWHLVVAIVLSNGLFNFFKGSISILGRSCLVAYKLLGMGVACYGIYYTRKNLYKCIFDKNQGLVDIDHLLFVTLSAIQHAWRK